MPSINPRIITRILALCLLAVIATPGGTTPIYKHVDENGNVHYSDSPQSNDDELVELPPINAQPAEAGYSSEDRPRRTQDDRGEYEVFIDNPVHDTTVPPGQTQVGVSGYVQPGMNFPAQFDLLYDGQVVQSNDTPVFVIDNLERGTHTLSIRVFDEFGVNIATSESIQIHVQRPTVRN